MPVPSRAVVPRDIRRYVRGVVRGRGGGKKERKKDGEETSFPTTILDRIDEKHNLVGVWSWVREVQRGSAGEGGGGGERKTTPVPRQIFSYSIRDCYFPSGFLFFSRPIPKGIGIYKEERKLCQDQRGNEGKRPEETGGGRGEVARWKSNLNSDRS